MTGIDPEAALYRIHLTPIPFNCAGVDIDRCSLKAFDTVSSSYPSGVIDDQFIAEAVKERNRLLRAAPRFVPRKIV